MIKTYYIILILFFTAIIYYLLEYRRSFISNNDKSEVVTIWQSFNGNCVIVPGRYYYPWMPKQNFLLSKNDRNYIGIIFNADDSRKFDISVYDRILQNSLI